MRTLKELMALVLNIERGKISDDSSSENISSWDSFNSLMIISELERNFGIRFSISEVEELQSIKGIKKLLRKKGIRKGID